MAEELLVGVATELLRRGTNYRDRLRRRATAGEHETDGKEPEVPHR